MAIAQKESAETAAAARSEFIASASHEIRTPLHHLQGYVESVNYKTRGVGLDCRLSSFVDLREPC